MGRQKPTVQLRHKVEGQRPPCVWRYSAKLYANRSAQAGDPLYSLQVTDPREILSNATVILNNYAGTTFNNKNLLNVFGFLEHDPSEPLADALLAKSTARTLFEVSQPRDCGQFDFFGDDNYHFFNQDNPFTPKYAGTFFTAGPKEMFGDELGDRFPLLAKALLTVVSVGCRGIECEMGLLH